MQSPRRPRLPPIVWSIAAFSARSFAGSFLTPAVLLTIATAVFAYIALGQPAAPLLGDLLTLLFGEGGPDVHLDTNDIMLSYSLISAVVGLITGAVKTLARHLFGWREGPPRSLMQPSIVGFLKSGLFFTSLVFTASLLLIPSAKIADDGSPLPFYGLFLFFYAVAVVCYAIYYGLNFAADYVPGQRRAPVEQGP